MNVSCPGCDNTYTIEDHLLPSDKNLILTCKQCKYRIKIDIKGDQKRKDSKIGVGLRKGAALRDSNSNAEQSPNDLKNQILKSIENLPPMPHVVIKAQQLMVDPNSSAKQVAGVIESDQAIAAKVLKMANSAYYGMSGKVSSIQHATVVLGYQTLGEIITTAGFSGFLEGKLPGYGYESKALWKHSLSVALASKMITAKKNHNLVNEAYTAGLIHDVGKVVLDNHILANKDQINKFMEEEEKTFFDAERHFFGFDHGEIASEICEKWNIPEKITLGIKCHHQPSISGGDQLSYILHMADYIATMGGIGYDDDDAVYRPEEGTIDFLGLKQDSIGEIMLKVMESVNKI